MVQRTPTRITRTWSIPSKSPRTTISGEEVKTRVTIKGEKFLVVKLSKMLQTDHNKMRKPKTDPGYIQTWRVKGHLDHRQTLQIKKKEKARCLLTWNLTATQTILKAEVVSWQSACQLGIRLRIQGFPGILAAWIVSQVQGAPLSVTTLEQAWTTSEP